MAYYPPRKTVKRDDGEMRLIDWQPGNGTRYEVYLFLSTDRILLAWWNKGDGSRMMIKDQQTMFHYQYMLEKMAIGRADAAALLALFAQETGIETVLPPGYDENGVWDGSEDSMLLNDQGAEATR